MKKTILTTLLVLAAITINAQFLFRINGRGLQKPSYILGSVHTMPGTILDSIPEFLKAEAECQQLYAEYDLSSQQKMDEVKTAGQQAPTLFVLGAGHLIGKDGIVNKLREAGYKVEQIKTN